MIKECPFCGGEAEIYDGEFKGERVFNVSCSECCATTPYCETKKIAVEIWNERTDLLSENKDGLLCCPCCGGEGNRENRRQRQCFLRCILQRLWFD